MFKLICGHWAAKMVHGHNNLTQKTMFLNSLNNYPDILSNSVSGLG